MIIDTHVHLNDERYTENISEIIDLALKNDVKKMIVIGYDKLSSLRAIAIAEEYDFIYAAIGLHPSEVHKEEDQNLQWLIDNLSNKKVVAIGEVGLDYYWDKTYVDLQKQFFIKQLEIANKYNLPVSIHSREACLDTFTILKDIRVRGVLHCYSGSLEMAKEYVKLGYYLGIGGVLTYKNNLKLKEIVKIINLENILVETDAPYLTPVPFRGKLNQPAYVKYVIDEIMNIKGLNIEEVKKIIEENTYNLFNIRR